MSDRRRQSLIRLEALGGLSDYYSDVATPRGRSFGPQGPINVNDQDQWDVDSVSSERSTTVVVFDKPPPPGGFRAPKNNTGHQAREAAERNGKEPHDSIRSRRLRRAHAQKDLGEAFDEEQLKSSKSLNSSRQIPVARPSSAHPIRDTSGNGSESSSRSQYVNINRPRSAVPPGATSGYEDQPSSRRVKHGSWQPQQLQYIAGSNDGGSSRPTSSYSAYNPSSQRPRGQSQSNSTSRALNTRNDQPPQVSEVSELNNDRGSRGRPRTSASAGQTCRRPQKADPLVDSLGLEVVAPTTKCPHPPPPIQLPSPCPSPSPSSPSSPSRREPSPSRGAWHSEHPRQKRASFIDRAQERMSRSIHEHLVKAGRRPPPSFEVLSVTKSPVEDVVAACWQTKSPPAPQRKREDAVKTSSSSPSSSSAPAPAPAHRGRANPNPGATPYYHRSSSSPNHHCCHHHHQALRQKESEELFFVGTSCPARASGLFDPEWTAAAAAAAAPGLKIDTQQQQQIAVAELPAEEVVPAQKKQPAAELEAPWWYLPQPSAGPKLDDSLFLGPGGSPADTSFFRQQQIAELPSDAGDEHEDDRRALPSQVRLAEYYHHQRQQQQKRQVEVVAPTTLSRKKGNPGLRYGEL
ncbi:hypothetical protein F5X96DRAFT_687457 [Biscogniauxia mediterranea]|nr:hypothetical protein F5X96DRAFT_687457 [Biscogniauxia mediterranea]